jgi:hypothetical protein
MVTEIDERVGEARIAHAGHGDEDRAGEIERVGVVFGTGHVAASINLSRAAIKY